MNRNYAFEEFVLRPAQRVLTRTSGDRVDIHAKAFDALVLLVQRRGELVSRAELTRTLWPKVVVEDNNLSQTIRALRRALGDTHPPYRFITTVPRRGYQFVAAAIEQPPEELHPTPAASHEPPRPARPRLPGAALYIASMVLATLLVTTVARRESFPEAPAPESGRPVADTVVEGYAPSWPLPEVVACLPESARLMDPERCAAAFRSVQEAERRRKLGLYEG